jgi:phosphoribosylformimino-5-aminoimidazole carboxamide ribotide isomerase
MIVIPAVDVRAGVCTQAAAIPDLERRAQLRDPLLAARYWAGCGFSRLHLLDADADTGKTDSAGTVNNVLRENAVTVQVGVGAQSADRVDELLANGARFVVISVHTINGLGWLEGALDLWPDAVLAAIAVRDERAIGPAHRTGMHAMAMIEELSAMRLAGVVVTATMRRGLMNGADVRLMAEAVQACSLPIYAAGGVGSRRNLDELADCGVTGAVVGTALYSGALEPRLLAEEYSGSS